MIAFLLMLLISGCSGAMIQIPEDEAVKMAVAHDAILKRQGEIFQSEATLAGKIDVLLQLKRDEVSKLSEANTSFTRATELLERVLTRQCADDAAGGLPRR
jgi:hypothetical protein